MRSQPSDQVLGGKWAALGRGSYTKAGQGEPCNRQMGPMLAFLLANGCVWPGFYSFLILGPWEKKAK